MGEPGRRYAVLSELGRGGFGTVYRARLEGSAGFAKTVALKLLNADANLPTEMLERLRDEARLLGVLRHRAVVDVDDLVELEQGWAVVMEYVPGRDVASLVAEAPLPLSVALRIVEEVADALHCAFTTRGPDGRQLGLIHRDIKPANIRLTPAGDVKLLDFGVARGELSTREARTGSLAFGSLPYMAPERLQGEDSPAGDVYALGLVLAEAVTGTRGPTAPPRASWHQAFVEETVARVNEVVALDALDRAVEEECSKLIESLLSYDPTTRPSANELVRRTRRLRTYVHIPDIRDWAATHVSAEEAAGAAEPGTLFLERRRTSSPPPPSRAAPPSGVSGAHVVAGATVLGGGLAAAAALGLLGVGIWAWARTAPLMPTAAIETAPTPVAEAVLEPSPISEASTQTAPAPEASAEGRPDDKGHSAVPNRPAPPPARVRRPSGRVHADGADEVWLVAPEGRLGLGEVPPGRYTIMARFGASGTVNAGTVTVEEGGDHRLHCDADWGTCQ